MSAYSWKPKISGDDWAPDITRYQETITSPRKP